MSDLSEKAIRQQIMVYAHESIGLVNNARKHTTPTSTACSAALKEETKWAT